MSDTTPEFTVTDLMAAASAVLTANGYQAILGRSGWESPSARIFEDQYNVVGVVGFETCNELMRSWPDMQGSMVDLISGNIAQIESKSWDGYLVLLTPGISTADAAELESIRYDTTRLRKLVATGDDLRGPTDIERVLLPLLPLAQERMNLSQSSALDMLPALLANQNIPSETTQLLVQAFQNQAPLMESLHDGRRP